jgi:hypothetical protein
MVPVLQVAGQILTLDGKVNGSGMILQHIASWAMHMPR